MRPSRVEATLRVTWGRPVVMNRAQGSMTASHAARRSPVSTATPARRRRRIPRPFTWGLGSLDPESTRRTPASRMARLQGGVRPKWSQGSSVV